MLPLGAFCNTLELHEEIISLEKHFGLFESGRFSQVILYTFLPGMFKGPNATFKEVLFLSVQKVSTACITPSSIRKGFFQYLK